MAEVEVPNPEELHERGGQTFSRRVALTTAIYAIVLSLAATGGNNAVKEMLLAQQQSSDQWAFYQAKVIREHQYRGQKMVLETQLSEPSTVKGAEREKLAALAAKFADEEKALRRREEGHREGCQEARARPGPLPRAPPLLRVRGGPPADRDRERVGVDSLHLTPDVLVLAGPGGVRRGAHRERVHASVHAALPAPPLTVSGRRETRPAWSRPAG